MPHEATELLSVNDTLRYVLYGVSIVLRIDMRASEIERLFVAASEGDSSAQSYEFHVSPLARVTGRVEDYEPGTVWLSVAARKFNHAELVRLIEAAEHGSFGRAASRRTA